MAENGDKNGEGRPKSGGDGPKKGTTPLLVALAAGCTIREAARLSGIGERTVSRRLADPDFQRQVTEARAEMLARAVGKLAHGATAAARTLRQLLSAGSENVRLGAARAMLELGPKLREAVELEERIAALEQRFGEDGKTRKPRGPHEP